MVDKIINVGVIGLGHWGPNHVRVFNGCEGAKVIACADLSEARREHIHKIYPDIHVTASATPIFANKTIDAVVVATPTSTHFEFARAAIETGKHVLLEKPMCGSLKEASQLVELARKAGVVLMPGHVFLYNRGIQFIKDGAIRGDFGRLEYLDATRTNLGPIRPDINAVQDLAVHEFSIFDAIFGTLPRWVSASGSCLLKTSREDVAFISLEYGGGLAHLHVSWLHPQKTRQMTLVGDKRMVVWNDMNAEEPLRIYDKGVAEEPYYNSFGEFQLLLRDREIQIPRLKLEEPLALQAAAFVGKLHEASFDASGAREGLRVMKCLEAAMKSLREDGRRVDLEKEGLL